MAMIRFFSDLGAEVFVAVDGTTAQQLRSNVLRSLRDYGRMGWRSGTVPVHSPPRLAAPVTLPVRGST